MRFCSEKALRQLLEGGVVATMRSYPYQKDQKVLIKSCDGRIIGRGVVRDVRRVDEESLKALLAFSGFDSVEEWVEEARRLHKRIPRYVVLVKSLKPKTG